MSIKNGKSQYRVDNETAALLGPSHVQDLTSAVASLERTVRLFDEQYRDSTNRVCDTMRMNSDALRDLTKMLRKIMPDKSLSTDTENEP